MEIGIASDHGGYELKQFIIENSKNIPFLDLGTNSKESVHYPLFADKICQKILDKTVSKGILICGTGIGISMRANRYPGIRAALVYDEFSAKMSKEHNNANILCIGGRTTTQEKALSLISIWLNTKFEGGRHTERIALIDSPIH